MLTAAVATGCKKWCLKLDRWKGDFARVVHSPSGTDALSRGPAALTGVPGIWVPDSRAPRSSGDNKGCSFAVREGGVSVVPTSRRACAWASR